jgi:hypothetical protein
MEPIMHMELYGIEPLPLAVSQCAWPSVGVAVPRRRPAGSAARGEQSQSVRSVFSFCHNRPGAKI